jgi:hypothetical protein
MLQSRYRGHAARRDVAVLRLLAVGALVKCQAFARGTLQRINIKYSQAVVQLQSQSRRFFVMFCDQR